MTPLQSHDIRSRFIAFFQKRNHAILQSAPLVTSDEKGVTNSTLFNTAGMQPLVPYLLGTTHPDGARLASIQKCVRTVDVDDIGDNTHATFFEMLGNWSLGDYWKKESIEWSYEFLTSTEEGLGLDPTRLYVTVFEGDENAPKDTESYEIWQEIFRKNNISGERIYFMGAKSNWWSAGDNGPCGPDTEMFYDLSGELTSGMTREEYIAADSRQQVVEVWNNVFMQYEKKNGSIIGMLPKRNVDTGAGLERLTAVVQGLQNIFDTDLFSVLMSITKTLTPDEKSARIVADHMRTAVFLIADGVVPSNTDRGYVLRRLIRRGVFNTHSKNFTPADVTRLVETVVATYTRTYSVIVEKEGIIKQVLDEEVSKFTKTLKEGLKQFEDYVEVKFGINVITEEYKRLPSDVVFKLVTSFGFPLELIREEAKKRDLVIDEISLELYFKQHQDLSRAGAEQKFKGGLADADDPRVVRYHTATHLLHQALHDVLGAHVEQKGSNITPDRLRFDFTHSQKMTDEEKKRVEDIVNEKIGQSIPVQCVVLPKTQAEHTGARHLFNEKYGEEVSIYFIGNDLEHAYSKEFCGGPHVTNTSELGHFKIQKEEAVASGVRRIKAVLE